MKSHDVNHIRVVCLCSCVRTTTSATTHSAMKLILFPSFGLGIPTRSIPGEESLRAGRSQGLTVFARSPPSKQIAHQRVLQPLLLRVQGRSQLRLGQVQKWSVWHHSEMGNVRVFIHQRTASLRAPHVYAKPVGLARTASRSIAKRELPTIQEQGATATGST